MSYWPDLLYSRYPNLLETLLGFLKTEQQSTIRSQTLRLLGLLGALDPYKYKQNTGQIDSGSSGGGLGQSAPLIPVTTDASEMELSYEMSPSEMLVNITGTTTSLDDFYPSVAIATLMKIIRDPTQVPWPLNSFFLCLLFCKISLIGLEGKSMTIPISFAPASKLPHLRIGPLMNFLS